MDPPASLTKRLALVDNPTVHILRTEHAQRQPWSASSATASGVLVRRSGMKINPLPLSDASTRTFGLQSDVARRIPFSSQSLAAALAFAAIRNIRTENTQDVAFISTIKTMHIKISINQISPSYIPPDMPRCHAKKKKVTRKKGSRGGRTGRSGRYGDYPP